MSPIFFNWQFRLIVETWKKMLGCIFLIGIYNKIRDLFVFPNTNLALDFSKNIFGGKKELTIKSLFVQCTTTVLPSPAAPGIPLILLGPCAVSVSLNKVVTIWFGFLSSHVTQFINILFFYSERRHYDWLNLSYFLI